jgi:hypothetical protein
MDSEADMQYRSFDDEFVSETKTIELGLDVAPTLPSGSCH